jgi:hypothetical protein
MMDFVSGELKINANASRTDAIELSWFGKSADRHPGKVLTPYFATALTEAGDRKVPIEMHFEKLEHFNSSTITAIIQLIQDSRHKQVPLVLVYDQGLKWQKLSFDALRVFAKPNLFELRTTG